MKITIFLVLCLFVLNAFADKGNRVRGNGGQPYGCVTGDTLVMLANNKEVAISSLKSGDILLNKNLDKIQVFYTLKGPENKKMYNIETETGKKIKATEGHPFYSINGYTPSKNLKVGIEVLTINGFEKIVKLSTFDFNGEVYNLAATGTESILDLNFELNDPFLGLNSSEHTVILNGFITGDVIIQRLLAM